MDADSSGGAAAHAYPQNLLRSLNALRMDDAERSLCDVEIVPGWSEAGDGGQAPRTFLAHRCVLAAASPYFNAMFTGGLAEATRQRIVLQAVGDAMLDKLLQFVYTGSVDVSRDNVLDVFVYGDMFQLSEVVAVCTRYLIGELETSNAVGIFCFAKDHNCQQLHDAALKFIFDNFFEVSRQEEFCDLSTAALMDLLQSEFLRIDSEYEVLEAGLRWLQADITARRQFIFEVLRHVRLPLVATTDLDRSLARVTDESLRVALSSVRRDLALKRGGLVALEVKPRRLAKKSIFVIGGSQREMRSAWTRPECCHKSVEVFDTFLGKWRDKPAATPLETGRIMPGIAVMGGRVFVCGGEFDSEILASGEVYDPVENTWVSMAPMLTPRCEFGLCALNGFLYAFGGWVGEDICSSIECYDPALNQWTMLAKMKEPRFSMGVLAYQGLVYMVGGCSNSRRHMQELTSYNPATNEWSVLASTIMPRSQMGCAILEDHLYVVGGTNRDNKVLTSVEQYSFKENAWRLVAPMHEARASTAVAAVNGRLYVFGGDVINEEQFYRARTTIAEVECYDPATNTWSKCQSLPESRSEAGAAVV